MNMTDVDAPIVSYPELILCHGSSGPKYLTDLCCYFRIAAADRRGLLTYVAVLCLAIPARFRSTNSTVVASVGFHFVHLFQLFRAFQSSVPSDKNSKYDA
jgi:hypothetical protein